MGLARFPDADTLVKGLEPCLSGVFKTEDGIQIVQKNVLPSGTPVSFLGSASVIAHAMYVKSQAEMRAATRPGL